MKNTQMKIKINKSLLLLLLIGVVSSKATAIEPISVLASANDGNIPSNTLDDSLNTRWSMDSL